MLNGVNKFNKYNALLLLIVSVNYLIHICFPVVPFMLLNIDAYIGFLIHFTVTIYLSDVFLQPELKVIQIQEYTKEEILNK